MPNSDHDRNLLFGILAVQMDFISRDQLVAAMNAWVLAKHKPLGEILVEQGALAAERRTLLDALVGEHLKLHADDPEQSLAAVSSVDCAGRRSGASTIPICTPVWRISPDSAGRSLCHAGAVGQLAHRR